MRFNKLGANLSSHNPGLANEMQTVLFSLFAMCVLMNAFNCREFGSSSIFPYFTKNKIAIQVISITMVLQILLTEVFKGFFNSVSLSPVMWMKIILLSSSVIGVSELVKLVKHLMKTKDWKRIKIKSRRLSNVKKKV